MTYLVPFDGSPLAEAALARAVEFAAALEEVVVALSVVPVDERDFAVERGWIDDGEAYDPDTVVDRLRSQVAEIAPDATFRCEHPEDVS